MIGLVNILSDWWNYIYITKFMGNTIGQWLAMLGVILAALVAGKILSFILLRQAQRMDAIEERFILLSLIVKSMSRPLSLMLMGGGLYVGGFIINIDPSIQGFYDSVCKTIAVLAGAWFIFRLVDIVEHFLDKWTSRTQTTLDDQLVPLIRKSMRVFVVIVAGLFIGQNIFEWNIASLLAGLGLGGLAVALAAKDTVANVFGSVTIFADRPFQMGDRIKIKGYDGVVEEVGFRSTRIRLLNGHLVVLPNNTVAGEPVENISRRPFIKRVLNVTITYDTSPKKVRRGVEILREMLDARKKHFPADCPPRVYFSDFNAESLNIVVYYWFAPPDWWKYLEFNHDFNTELLQRFNEEGIEFAFPTRTLYVKQGSPFEADVHIAPPPEK